MSTEDLIELNIQISAKDTAEEDVDLMTRRLLSELRELPIDSVELTEGEPALEGVKGDPISIGSIVIQVLPAVLPSLIAFIQAWSTRGSGRTVKFKGRVDRKLIEFEGSPEDFQKLLAMLEKGKKK